MKVILFALLTLLATSRIARAEDEFERLAKQLFAHPELGDDLTFMSQFRRAASQKGKLSALPPDLQKEVDRQVREAQARDLAKEKTRSAFDEKTPKVVRRITVDGGAPFPSATPTVDVSQIDMDEFAKSAQASARKLQGGEEAVEAAPPLPACDADDTVHTSIPEENEEAKELFRFQPDAAGFDMLFLAEEPPVDAKEIFGRRTRVIHYKAGTKDPVSLIAARLGVLCLPYRVRVTPKHLYWDVGKNALRNYDKDPEGRGEMHEYIKIKEQAAKGELSSRKRGKQHEGS